MMPVNTIDAAGGTRSLKLYYLHTGEKATITFKRNGKYVKSGLKKINRFLRDWRRNEPTKMDPRLLDLVWEVYKKAGSKAYIHVISGYRSPKTNKMLKKRGRGVASKSQHTLGKALDFYLPDVKLSKLRRIGLIKQVGGVGYYPKSGSPFIHLDTGRVRHWPRMNRTELARVFPNGKTLHVPTDGKPLKGFNIAKANLKKRNSKQGKIVIAEERASAAEKPKKKRIGLFARRSSGVEEREDRDSVTTPAPKPVKTTRQPAAVVKREEPAVKTPEPVEEPAKEIVVASLPKSVPVPRIAPRPKPVIVAEEKAVPEPAISEQVEPVDVQTIEAGPVIADNGANEPLDETQEEFSIASASSVPQRRPNSVDVAPDGVGDTNLLALVDPASPILPARGPSPIAPKIEPSEKLEAPVAVAALSPFEIQELRGRFNAVSAPAGTKAPQRNIVRPQQEVIKVKPVPEAVIPVADEPVIESPTEPTVLASLNAVDRTGEGNAANTITERITKPTGKVDDRLAAEPLISAIETASLSPVAPAIVTPAVNPIKAEAPKESAEPIAVASLQPIEPELEKQGSDVIPIQNPLRIEKAAKENLDEPLIETTQVASLSPIEPEVVTTGLIGLPTANPDRLTAQLRENEAEQEQVQIASLSPIEPGVRSSNQIAFPQQNPEQQARRLAILERLALEGDVIVDPANEDTGEGRLLLASQQTPIEDQEEVSIASLSVDPSSDDEVFDAFSDEEIEDENQQLAAVFPVRQTSLDRFSMPDFQNSGIGRFALILDRTILEIDEIRSPAYGRNAIRELPSTILSYGFSLNQQAWPLHHFAARSSQRLAFAKFGN